MTKEIELTQNQVALVDNEDYNFLMQRKWQAHKDGNTFYARYNLYIGMIDGKEKRKTIRMHRLIMAVPKGKIIDHINGNGLDNQKSNLRICSKRQNNQNRVHSIKSSKYPGVSWYNTINKWVARIRINGKAISLGRFTNEKDAAMAYEKACRTLVGEELICKT